MRSPEEIAAFDHNEVASGNKGDGGADRIVRR
jgi:hypothetical protein